MFHILVAEDDANTRRLMGAVLKENGYVPILAGDGAEALRLMEQKHVDLLVTDIMMPQMDGYQLTEALRESGHTLPILMVTAKEMPMDKKKGFLIGTDDYMVKPVDEEEMLLRIAALLRRSQIVNQHKLSVGDTVFDYDGLAVLRDGRRQELPPKEFMLAYKLLSYPGQIFTRRQLMDEIWDLESESEERTVDVHINRLREKFRDNPDFEFATVRGLGYKAVKK